MITFSDPDLEAIRAAVHDAEGITSGEIVPFVAIRSDRYDAALLRGAALFSLLGAAALIASGWSAGGWAAGWLHSPVVVVSLSIAAGGLGWLVAYSVPSVRRLLAGSSAMATAVHRRALKAFVDEEVFDTRDRTGILLFVSLFERRIEVLGDAGINARVSPDDWADVVATVRDGIASGKTVEGLTEGIRACGELLRRKGVEIRPDDDNELSDGLRVDLD